MSFAASSGDISELTARPEWFAHIPFRDEFVRQVRARTPWNGTVPVKVHTALPNTEMIWFATLPEECMASREVAFRLVLANGRVEFTIRGYGEFENSGFVRTDTNGTAAFNMGTPACKEYGSARLVAGGRRIAMPYASMEEAPHLHIHPLNDFGRNDVLAWLRHSSVEYIGFETKLWSPLKPVPANGTGIVYFDHEKFTRFLPWEKGMSEPPPRSSHP